MSHPYVWHDSWLIHMCDTTHPWLMHVCDTAHDSSNAGGGIRVVQHSRPWQAPSTLRLQFCLPLRVHGVFLILFFGSCTTQLITTSDIISSTAIIPFSSSSCFLFLFFLFLAIYLNSHAPAPAHTHTPPVLAQYPPVLVCAFFFFSPPSLSFFPVCPLTSMVSKSCYMYEWHVTHMDLWPAIWMCYMSHMDV